jgi:hypothetical protein
MFEVLLIVALAILDPAASLRSGENEPIKETPLLDQ